MTRILFILKRREHVPDAGSFNTNADGKLLSTGLTNSVEHVMAALTKLGVPSHVVHAIDGNCIDREVTLYNPTHVIIEAFWCPPYKLAELMPLHPQVKWIIRNHSKMEFLAGEGIAFGWLLESAKLGVDIASNSKRAVTDIHSLLRSAGTKGRSIYLPNFYSIPDNILLPDAADTARLKAARLRYLPEGLVEPQRTLKVGCMGAIRPLKNTLNQALACIRLADARQCSLEFHINGNRFEGGGNGIVKNLRNIFSHLPQHRLVEVDWLDPPALRQYLPRLDVMLQVSISETFNIVAADAIVAGVPSVVSPEVSWLDVEYHADPLATDSIAQVTERVLASDRKAVVADQRLRLAASNEAALEPWRRLAGA